MATHGGTGHRHPAYLFETALLAAAEREAAFVRLAAVSEPAYLSMVVDEAVRRGVVMGSDTAGFESVYQDIVSARWRPTARWGP
jgi:hypothetical protein